MESTQSAAEPLLVPRDGVPEPVDTDAELAAAVSTLRAGAGPVAVDAERASGYRYGQRAYLVQLRRAGTGTILIDPTPFADLRVVNDAIGDAEWVLHAASQDLPCLTEISMRPKRLFDTELAGRLGGYARVGLGAMVEELLGFALEKGHSAVDWSTRPLPHDWLVYAALDVEVLVELRDALKAELSRQGKLEWALEEFEALASAPPPPPRAEPWRRTSGIHKVRNVRGLARVRALWEARDALAQQRDTAPGRVLPDGAIIAAALAQPTDEHELFKIGAFAARHARRSAHTWLSALRQAAALTDAELPGSAPGASGPPPLHRWSDKNPEAAVRLAKARAAVAELAEQHNVPTENLLAPALIRQLAWIPPTQVSAESVGAELRERGARSWQIDLSAQSLAVALT
ncbi:MAG: ribonuclease D [Corynebacteriales bacterium]|nr:ribonuclease D [Mycobacteriales bacterium]